MTFKVKIHEMKYLTGASFHVLKIINKFHTVRTLHSSVRPK